MLISLSIHVEIFTVKICLILLLNQTWIGLAMCSKVNLLIQGCGEGKCCIFAGTNKESRWLMLKRPEPPDGFFKDRVRESVVGCVISSWTFFCLVGGEVIGSQHHQPSSSNHSGIQALVSSIQLTSSTWWGFQYLQNSSKDMAQNIIYSS